MGIGLIASGAFVSEGLSAELGRIPACFVPLGNDRLFYHQYSIIRNWADKIFVTLPASFEMHPIDQQRIEKLGVKIIYSDPTIQIGESIANFVNSIGVYDEELVILYGDTVISGVDSVPSDGASIHQGWGEYNWAELRSVFGSRADEYSDMTLSGLFSFSSVPELLRSIMRTKGDFLSAMRLYNESIELQFFHLGEWFDFGHVQTYFQSSGLVTTQRSFNKLQINKREVVKSSEDPRKIKSEAAWFTDIPKHLTTFTPSFLGEREIHGRFGYATSNTYLSTLANLNVFGDLKTNTWGRILDACAEFLQECRRVTPNKSLNLHPDQYFSIKTRSRMADFSQSESGSLLLACRKIDGKAIPSISEMIAVTNEIIHKANHGGECIIHGDFCFSNIFFDFRSSSIKVIDPRGQLPDGTRSIFGIQSYDIAKLAHSIIGGYDMIIANYFPCKVHGQTISTDSSYFQNAHWQSKIKVFMESEISTIQSMQTLYAMMVHLFLSMLPLHADRPDRQTAMLANAHKFYLLAMD